MLRLVTIPISHFYGTPLPQPEVLPPHIAALVNRAREHPAGRYALELFSERPDTAVIVA